MKNGKYILRIAPPEYPGKKYRGRYCYEHHLVYWEHYGIIPQEGEVIHHKDGNTHNNDIDNLQLIDETLHRSHHGKLKKVHMVLLVCPTCGKPFISEYRCTHLSKGGNATHCSKKCAYLANTLRAQNDKNYEKGVENNVLHEFYAFKPDDLS